LATKSDSDLAHEVTTTLLRVINKIQIGRRTSRQYGKAGALSLIEAEMCLHIARDEGTTGGELARVLGVTPSATSQVISRLKKKGLVQETLESNNAKRKLLSLTSKGREVAEIALGYSESMQKTVYDTSRSELLAYLRFVRKLENYHTSFLESQADARK
jgi:DNA-binding MarR family transcriptional regulator